MIEIRQGDCLEVLRIIADASVDSIVTDPPYGLSFMGKRWDYDVPAVEVWAECLRVLKPGGHLLAFAGTRTQHRMAVRIEDAGFEIRDMLAWVYGSGFPKSLDVSKAIDKAAGAEREVVGRCEHHAVAHGAPPDMTGSHIWSGLIRSDEPATDAARQWQGWGTALKPALEPITVARKPLVGTVAENVLAHGTGALNIDGCRVETADDLNGGRYSDNKQGDDGNSYGSGINKRSTLNYEQPVGRWPANLIHDGSEDVLAGFPQAGASKSGGKAGWQDKYVGGTARFFYCAKASKRDRGEGNNHPTVKPTDLMRYLCRLVTPPGGTVLDPFMGSGSTGKAAMLEGFRFLGIEIDPTYVEIAKARIEHVRSSTS